MIIVVGVEPREDNELVNADDAARYLGITKNDLYSRAANGRIRAFKIRSGDPHFPYYNLYPKCDLDKFKDKMIGKRREHAQITRKVADRVVELYREYLSIQDIAIETGLPVARVRDVLHRRIGRPLPARRDIIKTGRKLTPTS